MRSRAVPVSGETSRAPNVEAVPIRNALFLRQQLDRSRSSALPVRIPGETFRWTGILPRVPTGGYFYSSVYSTRN